MLGRAWRQPCGLVLRWSSSCPCGGRAVSPSVYRTDLPRARSEDLCTLLYGQWVERFGSSLRCNARPGGGRGAIRVILWLSLLLGLSTRLCVWSSFLSRVGHFVPSRCIHGAGGEAGGGGGAGRRRGLSGSPLALRLRAGSMAGTFVLSLARVVSFRVGCGLSG